MTPQQRAAINQNCLNSFNNSALGKVSNFFSPLSQFIGPDRLGSAIETDIGGGIKYGLVRAGLAAGNAAVSFDANPLKTLAGLAAEGTEFVAKEVGLPLVVAGTAIQVTAHLGCNAEASSNPGQAGAVPSIVF